MIARALHSRQGVSHGISRGQTAPAIPERFAEGSPMPDPGSPPRPASSIRPSPPRPRAAPRRSAATRPSIPSYRATPDNPERAHFSPPPQRTRRAPAVRKQVDQWGRQPGRLLTRRTRAESRRVEPARPPDAAAPDCSSTLQHQIADGAQDLPERRIVLAHVEKVAPEIGSSRSINEIRKLVITGL